MASLFVTVSQNAVIQAESEISHCSRCTTEASTPFWQILDSLRSHTGTDVVYFLPVLASCPSCRSSIDETTLVEAKRKRTEGTEPFLVQCVSLKV